VAVVRHVLLVHDPAAAERLAAEVRAAGYDASIDTHDGGWTWIVRATEPSTEPPAEPAAGSRERLAGLAARHGAEYEGWQADATPDDPP
jgi:hypothetical protein